MTKLSSLVEDFASKERPAGILLSEEQLQALAVSATRMYAGFAPLWENSQKTLNPDTGELETIRDLEPISLSAIDSNTELTVSEWAVIRPLFVLYVEYETAINLEASRGMGVEPFGRSSSEIKAEIQQFENELSHRAFVHPVETII